jgi:hypothetical protein
MPTLPAALPAMIVATLRCLLAANNQGAGLPIFGRSFMHAQRHYCMT